MMSKLFIMLSNKSYEGRHHKVLTPEYVISYAFLAALNVPFVLVANFFVLVQLE